MNTIVQAGAEELIWIVVGVFWVIAQIAGGAAKKKMAPSQPPSENEGGGKTPEDPPVLSNVEGFADLMRKLSGVQEIKASPHSSSPVDAVSPTRSHPVQNAVRTPHLQKEKPTPIPKAPPVGAIAEVDVRPTMSSFRNIMPAMKLPSMKMSFQTSEKSNGISPMLGNIINPADKQMLRRAMLSHIIFSPPKALEGLK